MTQSRKHEIGVGILVLAAMGVLAYMSIKVGALRNVGEEIQVQAELSDAAGLSDGAAVRIAGVQIGQVLSMGVEHDKAKLIVSLHKDAQVRTDATAKVRARSILGEKYLEITPKSKDAPLMSDGAIIAIDTEQTEIDELVNSLGPLVDAVDADSLSITMARLTQALEDDPDRLARMLRDMDTVIGQAATASEEIPGLVSDTRSTLTSVRDVADSTQPVIDRTNQILTRVDQATEDLPQIADDVEAMVTDARAVIADSRTILERLERSTEDLELVMANLSEIDKWELRRLLREEGILIRMKAQEVETSQ